MKLSNILKFTTLLILVTGFNTASADASGRQVFKVANVRMTDVLNVRQKPTVHSKVLLQLPADAKWIIKRTSDKQGAWQKVLWGANEGWINTNYIQSDEKATQFLSEHRKCVISNPQNSMCCGFNSPTAGRDSSSKPIETFMVVKVAKGQSLNVRATGHAAATKIANIPHNAVGIVKLPGQKMKSGHSTWQKIRWNGRNGWVNSSYLKYDPIISDYRNIVQQACSN